MDKWNKLDSLARFLTDDEEGKFIDVKGYDGKPILLPNGVMRKIQDELGISSTTINKALSGEGITTILMLNIRAKALELGGNYERVQ